MTTFATRCRQEREEGGPGSAPGQGREGGDPRRGKEEREGSRDPRWCKGEKEGDRDLRREKDLDESIRRFGCMLCNLGCACSLSLDLFKLIATIRKRFVLFYFIFIFRF
uniref:Uncharacterized protein n=2 Tax=Physcomitrium patens TaxID=3218 RepID=A0A2K1JV39_PHYPA|nr:hypothetical protein PHYPA_015163 [Physcomitrium patens]